MWYFDLHIEGLSQEQAEYLRDSWLGVAEAMPELEIVPFAAPSREDEHEDPSSVTEA